MRTSCGKANKMSLFLYSSSTHAPHCQDDIARIWEQELPHYSFANPSLPSYRNRVQPKPNTQGKVKKKEKYFWFYLRHSHPPNCCHCHRGLNYQLIWNLYVSSPSIFPAIPNLLWNFDLKNSNINWLIINVEP